MKTRPQVKFKQYRNGNIKILNVITKVVQIKF